MVTQDKNPSVRPGGSEQTAPASPAPARGRKPLRRFTKIAAAAVLVLALLAPFVWRAYRATLLREAYLPELARITQENEFNGPAQALYGARLAQAGQYAASSQALEHALAAGENSSLVWLAWAASLSAGGNKQNAYAALKMAQQKASDPAAIQQTLDRCRSLPATTSPSALAEALCPDGPDRLVKAYTGGSWLNGLIAWWGRRHPEQSGFTTREQWAAEQPTNTQAQSLWGEALLRNQRYVEAATVAQHCLDLNANQPEAHRLLGDSFLAQGASSKAALQYTAALKQRPDWMPALLGMGRSALNLKLLGISVDVYQRAVKQAPDSVEAWIGLGNAYYNQRIRFGEALAAFQKAEALAPGRTDFFADYSNTLRANFKFEAAEAKLRKRLAAVPQDARCNYLLALLLEDFNPNPAREAEAEQRLRTALQLEPDQTAAAAQLGKLLLDKKNPTEAIPLLEQVTQTDPMETSALMNLARAYRMAGRSAEAEKTQSRFRQISQYVARQKYLEDQLRRQPLNIALHLQLARHYAQGGQNSKAQMLFDAAYMLQTDKAKAVRGLNALNTQTLPAPTVPGH